MIGLLAIITLFGARQSNAQEELEDIVITNYDYSNTLWSGGRFAVPVNDEMVGVEFEMTDAGVSLAASLGSERIDLTTQVRNLKAFPNRMQFGVYNVDDGVVELIISLPYVDANGHCFSRSISIKNFSLAAVEDALAAPVRCAY